MSKFVVVNSAWVSLTVPYGFSFGLVSNDQFWDYSASAFVAAPTVTNAVKPFVKSGSPAHASVFRGDVPDIVQTVSADVLVYVHAPLAAGGYGVAVDVFRLKPADQPVSIRPITITTTVN